MRRLERRFGKPHPELEGHKPVPSTLFWLQSAFFRLHQRRQLGEHGMQPITFSEMIEFSEKALRLKPDLTAFFVKAIEQVDDAVLEDFRRKRADSKAR